MALRRYWSNISSVADESRWIAGKLRKLLESGVADSEIVVVATTNSLLDRYMAAADAEGIKPRKISSKAVDFALNDGVRFATIHRIKGLEFRYVFLVGMQPSSFSWLSKPAADPVAQRAREQ